MRGRALNRDRLPILPLVIALAGGALLMVPLVALAGRTAWSTLLATLGGSEIRTPLRLSLVCSGLATVASVAAGIPLAWVLARVEFPGRRILRAATVVPLVLPPVVGGVALLSAFGTEGLLGPALDALVGIRLPFTTAGAVVAETFVAMPFLVLSAEAAFQRIDPGFEEAARSLGAKRRTVFRRVTIPLSAPALAAGVALTWARALGEFGATVTFAGSAPGRTTTIPLEIYRLLDAGHTEGAVALSLVLLAVSLVIMVALRDRWIGGW